jgi:hypothetical protein
MEEFNISKQTAVCFFPRQEVYGVHKNTNLENTTSQVISDNEVVISLVLPKKGTINKLRNTNSKRVSTLYTEMDNQTLDQLSFVAPGFLTKIQNQKKSPEFLTQNFVSHHFNTTWPGGVKLLGDFFCIFLLLKVRSRGILFKKREMII